MERAITNVAHVPNFEMIDKTVGDGIQETLVVYNVGDYRTLARQHRPRFVEAGPNYDHPRAISGVNNGGHHATAGAAWASYYYCLVYESVPQLLH